MSVRAKFVCQKVDQEQGRVVLSAVTDGGEENERFFKYTPSGHLDMSTVNPAALAQFEEGADYYLDFTKA